MCELLFEVQQLGSLAGLPLTKVNAECPFELYHMHQKYVLLCQCICSSKLGQGLLNGEGNDPSSGPWVPYTEFLCLLLNSRIYILPF